MVTLGNVLVLVGFLAVIVGVVGLLGSVVPKLRRRQHWIRNSALLVPLGFITFLIGVPLSNSKPPAPITSEVAGATTPEVVEATAPEPVKPAAPEPVPITEPPPAPVTQAKPEPELISIYITSDPSGADVYIHSILKGRTPLGVTIPANEDRALRVQAQDEGGITLYKTYFGKLNFAQDDEVSVWLERTSAEEQQVQQVGLNESYLNNSKGDVKETCQKLVKAGLKAPSTAQFGGWYDEETTYSYDGGEGRAFYLSFVDAQNDFGAMLRNTFMCSYDMNTNYVKLELFE